MTQGRGFLEVPVLMFHEISPTALSDPDPYSLTPKFFTELLDELSDNGWRSVALDDLLKPPGGNERRVLLTFDDARRGVLDYAIAACAARGFTGVAYAIAGRTGNSPNHLDALGLQELAAAGWTIGTHTVSHRHLTGLSLAEWQSEWVDSRCRLEQMLNRPVLHGSLPGGRGGAREAAAAASAGLRSLATSEPGLWRAPASPLAIPRLVAGADLRGKRLKRTLAGDWRALAPIRARHRVLALLKRGLGDIRYDQWRKRLLGVDAGELG